MAVCALVVIGVAVAAARSSPHFAFAKLDPGLRHQYVPGLKGVEFQDLLLKYSDIKETANYDPDRDNGYLLFTRYNRNISQSIPRGDNNTLEKSYYDPKKRTVLLVHGWINNPSSPFNTVLVAAFLEADDVNVIVTDWSIGAAVNYVPAILNCIRSGISVSKYLKWLVEASGGSLARFHLVGHSLGGHQVGIIGRHVGRVVPYITSLDPAGPGWRTNPNRFNPEDGLYTEVIHSNGGGLGFLLPLGQVDFYPNGGISMPGCKNLVVCNHYRSFYYLAESLKGEFLGSRCENLPSALIGHCDGSTLNMGGLTPKSGYTGLYYLETNAYSPYSKD